MYWPRHEVLMRLLVSPILKHLSRFLLDFSEAFKVCSWFPRTSLQNLSAIRADFIILFWKVLQKLRIRVILKHLWGFVKFLSLKDVLYNLQIQGWIKAPWKSMVEMRKVYFLRFIVMVVSRIILTPKVLFGSAGTVRYRRWLSFECSGIQIATFRLWREHSASEWP